MEGIVVAYSEERVRFYKVYEDFEMVYIYVFTCSVGEQ